MSRIILYPYKLSSQAARLLQAAFIGKGLPCIRVKQAGKYKPRGNDTIINWGNSKQPTWEVPGNILNSVDKVEVAVNKLLTFQALKEADVLVPEFTTDVDEVSEWLETGDVVARHLLKGTRGKGIEILSFGMDLENNEIPSAPLYTKYCKKKDEYRVHVFNGEIIDVRQKKKRKSLDNDLVDYKIRNHRRGWVFCQHSIHPPGELLAVCKRAVNVLGLTFGAVDVVWNKKYQKATVLEVNTAPGLHGTTLVNYVNAIMSEVEKEST